MAPTAVDRTVASEPAALRIGDAMRLLPLVLLRRVPRVQCAYAVWHERMVRYENGGRFSEADVAHCLVEDVVELNALVRELKLVQYKSWLPKMLWWEFQRVIEGAPALEVTVPDGLDWATRGKRPKQKPGAMGGYRLENIEQHLDRFVLSEVLGVSKKAIARQHGCTARDVRHSLRRARELLDCIDAPMPAS